MSENNKLSPGQDGQSLTQLTAEVRDLRRESTDLREKVEARLYDTRPIWERVLAELTALREDFNNFHTETNKNLKLMNHQLEILNNDFMKIRAELRDLDDRVTRLEPPSA